MLKTIVFPKVIDRIFRWFDVIMHAHPNFELLLEIRYSSAYTARVQAKCCDGIHNSSGSLNFGA